jgi:hypothetical protein
LPVCMCVCLCAAAFPAAGITSDGLDFG